jgi:hypothetical protein
MADNDRPIQLQPCTSSDSEPGTPFTVIQRFLESSTSDSITSDAAAAVVDLTGPMTTNNCSRAANDPLYPSNHIYRIFSHLTDIALQIPHSHIWHQRLASLLRAIKGQPPPPLAVSEAVRLTWGTNFNWETFPTFALQQGELFDHKNRFEWQRRRHHMWSEMWSPQEWLSINKFISLLVAENLVGEGRTGLGFDRSGLLVLSHTLEVPRLIQTLEDNVPVAAVWILTAGKWIYEHRGLPLESPWRALESRFEEYDGPDGLNDERWEFWKFKFQELSDIHDLREETRAWARAAADHMAVQESLAKN